MIALGLRCGRRGRIGCKMHAGTMHLDVAQHPGLAGKPRLKAGHGFHDDPLERLGFQPRRRAQRLRVDVVDLEEALPAGRPADASCWPRQAVAPCGGKHGLAVLRLEGEPARQHPQDVRGVQTLRTLGGHFFVALFR